MPLHGAEQNDDPKFRLDKVYETAEIMMARRKIELTEEDKAILKHVYVNFRLYIYWNHHY